MLRVDAGVTDIVQRDSSLVVRSAGHEQATRRLMICTGTVYELPNIDGSRELWGTAPLGCPYCHGGTEPIEDGKTVAFRRDGGRLIAVSFEDGSEHLCDAMFVRPVQRQVPVVAALGLALDAGGFVVEDDEQRSSTASVYAGGDLVTHEHGALTAAASASHAAHCLNQADRRASDVRVVVRSGGLESI